MSVDQERISFRWGIPQLDRNNTTIPACIMEMHGRLGVKGNEFVLMVQLSSFKYECENSACHPSLRTLAERMGISRQAVAALVYRLSENGHLIVTRRKSMRGDYVSNEYNFAPFSKSCWDLWNGLLAEEEQKQHQWVSTYVDTGVNVRCQKNKKYQEEENVKDKLGPTPCKGNVAGKTSPWAESIGVLQEALLALPGGDMILSHKELAGKYPGFLLNRALKFSRGDLPLATSFLADVIGSWSCAPVPPNWDGDHETLYKYNQAFLTGNSDPDAAPGLLLAWRDWNAHRDRERAVRREVATSSSVALSEAHERLKEAQILCETQS